MIFFTSDTHFGHAKVIEYCKRPFSSVAHMDAELIRRWNYRVQAEDTVYHLGDFSLGKREDIRRYRSYLNGRIILIRGNHDRSRTAMLAAGFEEVHNSLELTVHTPIVDSNQNQPKGETKLFLRHIPAFDPKHPGKKYAPEFLKEPKGQFDYFLCGHVHEHYARKDNIINVGVDVRDFKPRTLWELLNQS
jgi:calcineurin-like phosphoesterase family protein